MPKDHATFHSVNGKRRVLVVDDQAINREMMGAILENDYEVVFAADGEEALQRVFEFQETLSVILLDLVMPNMTGQEVLKRLKATSGVQRIPVIVVSADSTQEIKCLNLGASDFIQKPYPDAGVIRARILRTIELSEDRQIIQSTERDPLTGLYNIEFFYSYAEQFDHYHKDMAMDAIVLNINHFTMINERFGRSYGEEVLRAIGEKAREMVHDAGGIVCRSGEDAFLVYCPHRDDYKAILDKASAGLPESQGSNSRVRLRMGVYSDVDKDLDIERRFARAKMAADSVRNSYTRNISVYDDTLHKSEMYSQRLIDDFATAIEQRQFTVFYQPKFDIRGETPQLCSAEALVRWQHPELGLISPGVFIPLFEENGLIQALDHYVWREAARQIRAWEDGHIGMVPISVNVSRVDMYDSSIVDTLTDLVGEYDLEPSDLLLEVTETAYAEDSEQIIETVKRLRSLGFRIEMDDFGTGYSSLNMLATLPIDALKLDMHFVRTTLGQEQDSNAHMLKVIIDIADHLNVPVIAEGVETIEQLNALKDLGCDIVQGYYFSEPVPAERFESFLEKGWKKAPGAPQATGTAERTHDTQADEQQDAEAAQPRAKWWEKVPGISLARANLVFMLVAVAAAVALFVSDSLVTQGYMAMDETSERYITAQQSATNLEIGSDYLTESVRSFVVTGKIEYLQNYFEELDTTKRRDTAVSSLENLLGDSENVAYQHLETALALSNELVGHEYRAMKLILTTGDYDEALVPDPLKKIELTPTEQVLSPQDKQKKAEELVFGSTYANYKNSIKSHTAACTQEMIAASNMERRAATENMSRLVTVQTVFTIVFLVAVAVIVVFISGWVRQPLARMVQLMREKKLVQPAGAQELQFVSRTYNDVFEEARRRYEKLNYGSMHDALTGLFNRKAYDIMVRDIDMSNTALMLIDVDRFKSINDTYGHDVGDNVLKRVAEVLGYSFRSTDLVFRLGGDEFVVIMTHVDSSIRNQVKEKIDQANVMLQQPTGDIPPTSLSVGVAFGDRENPEGDIFKDADTALYRVKEAGRCGCVIY